MSRQQLAAGTRLGGRQGPARAPPGREGGRYEANGGPYVLLSSPSLPRVSLAPADGPRASRCRRAEATGAADRAAAKELYAKWAEERAAGGSGGGEKKEAPTWRDAIANGRRERAERLAREKEEKEAREREAAAAALAAGRRG